MAEPTRAKTFLNRRKLLAGIATAATAASVAHTASPATSEAVSESPRLLELADQLPMFVAALVAARKHRAKVYKAAMAEWPDAPEQIIHRGIGMLHDVERDVSGSCRQNDNCVKSADHFRSGIDFDKGQLKRKVVLKNPTRIQEIRASIKEDRKDLRVAVAYEKECARIKGSCGYEAVADDYRSAQDALHAHVDAIMCEPSTTMVGVVVKAQALDGWSKADRFDQFFNLKNIDWPNAMASAVLQQGGAA